MSIKKIALLGIVTYLVLSIVGCNDGYRTDTIFNYEGGVIIDKKIVTLDKDIKIYKITIRDKNSTRKGYSVLHIKVTEYEFNLFELGDTINDVENNRNR